ncbi:MAG: threonine--tRNA ligase [Minisyncoccia bacterium]
MEKADKLDGIRHSLAHLLAAAVLKKFPKAKMAIGPVIENGFYYDFKLPRPLTPEDLKEFEKEMRHFVNQRIPFSGRKVTLAEAKKIFKEQPFKLELIKDFAKEKAPLSVYKTGDVFLDLCRGGHVKNTSEIPADGFKLSHVAGAYWKGDEKNPMLTRIYGLAFNSKKELEDYEKLQEEAKKRDHRKLGADLDLFVFSDIIGKGLPLLTPKGTIIRKELEKFVYETETKWGYQHVITPPLAKVELYEKSGHYPYYKNTMYPVMQVDEDKLILRPMTCPHHFMLYKSRPHSYRELPMRIAELASQFRYEKSGELTGLMRVRMFCLADAHIITPPEKAKEEIKKVLDLIDYMNETLGLKKGVDYRYRLSLGDRKDPKKYYKDDKAWDKAEDILRSVLKEVKAPFSEAENEAAFYGPKIDVQMKKVNGQEETAFTVQYDFVMPKRFELTYIDEGGKEKQPIVIHRSSIGAFERTMALLIEFYAGDFPVWLAPVQARVVPVSDRHRAYGEKVLEKMKNADIRADMANEGETLGKNIRQGELEKIPYLLIIGDREMEKNSVNIRERHTKETRDISTDKFVEEIGRKISEKK